MVVDGVAVVVAEVRKTGSSPRQGLNHLRVIACGAGYAIVATGDEDIKTSAMFTSSGSSRHTPGQPANQHR